MHSSLLAKMFQKVEVPDPVALVGRIGNAVDQVEQGRPRGG
jgi:hypothetical protein